MPEIESVKERTIRSICMFLCLKCGIEPIDSMDGSSNWWMFSNDVGQMIDNLEKRGFQLLPPIQEAAQENGAPSGVGVEENPGKS